MVWKRAGGFILTSYTGDYLPYHVHIMKDGRGIGRWDIENQRPMDDFLVSRRLKKALRGLGYLTDSE